MPKSFIYFFLSFIIVAFGQPAWAPSLAPFSAICGYALFWRSLDFVNFEKNKKKSAFFWSLFVQFIQCSWFISLKYQGLYIIFVYLIISIFISIQFLFLTNFLNSQKNITFQFSLTFASAGVLLEWVRFFPLCGFSFNLAGMGLAAHVIPMQFASIFGVLGLSFLVYLTNVLMLGALKGLFDKKSKIVLVLVSLFPYFFGVGSFFYDKLQKDCRDFLGVLLVQPGLSPAQKMVIPKYRGEFISPYLQWCNIFEYVEKYKNEQVDVIVLPESCVALSCDSCVYVKEYVEQIVSSFGLTLSDSFFLHPECCQLRDGKFYLSNAFWCYALSEKFNCPVIAGFDQYDKELKKHFNSAFYFDAKKFVKQRYEKRILLPLAEVLPWGFLKKFTEYYGISEFFSPGLGPKLFDDKKKYGVSVCIEETYPEIMRDLKNAGAKILINITNDGWYPGTNLPFQHFSHSRLRAVENGLPLARACNTGVTCVVNSQGVLINLYPYDNWKRPASKGALYSRIELSSKFTLYSFFGDSGIISLSIIFLLIFMKKRFVKT